MIVELMRPAGPDLVRRWVAALLIAPPEDREAIVRGVEERVSELYIETPVADEPAAVEVRPVKPPASAG